MNNVKSGEITPSKPKFMSCSVHLMDLPWSMIKGDPSGLHFQDEAIQKIHRFCHEIYRVPITWLCSWGSLHKFKDQLIDFIRNHGDEVAIMDGVIWSAELLEGEPEKYQSWVEECGLKRPGWDFHPSDAGEVRPGALCLHDMTFEEQKVVLGHLKKRYDEILGQNTRTYASPMNNGDTIRAMKQVGLDVLQGYNWDYFCEGINHKGCLLQSFRISTVNHVVPEQADDSSPVISIAWGPISPLLNSSVEAHSRMGMPGYCLNALELANRSEGHDKFRYHEKVIQEWFSQTSWNDFVFTPLQLEAIWMDEGKAPTDYYDQYPRFNSSNTEIFYTEIETALRCGAHPLTLSVFADWHRENIKDTAPHIYYSEDPLPDLKSKGKDQPYQPMVVYGDKKKQYWFLKSRGMNYVRRYLYETPVPNKKIEEEYPFTNEPNVFLKAKSSHNIKCGLSLSQQGAVYEIAQFELSAYHDDPAYAAVFWEANIPAYVRDSEIEIGGPITGFRTLREKNTLIVFAQLKKGVNSMTFRSEAPGKHVRINSVGKVGKRYEIWIENDQDDVQLHTIRAVLEPGLKIGGFWWDGYYSHSLFRYGWGEYHRDTGEFNIQCFYPATLKVNRGLTRLSIELFS